MKQLLIILKGKPLSGKTTWARKYIKKHKNTIIVNKDSLRLMYGKYDIFDKKNEKLVFASERLLVKEALLRGFNVIIDSVNLKSSIDNKWNMVITEVKKENKELEISIITYRLEISKFKANIRNFKRILFNEPNKFKLKRLNKEWYSSKK